MFDVKSVHERDTEELLALLSDIARAMSDINDIVMEIGTTKIAHACGAAQAEVLNQNAAVVAELKNRDQNSRKKAESTEGPRKIEKKILEYILATARALIEYILDQAQ
ncbi:uncharacterized protein LOC100899739 [Galendromus occidentalis]|uniref:Uncharacterized protein LOC100899739 n=1 Tax=Galendromus occidentalis TaxID=34638 RepID=A0AAJ6QPW4_9ACAR|nr:uncharacterized protein LOC100899739 [Galendromus occidentalis]